MPSHWICRIAHVRARLTFQMLTLLKILCMPKRSEECLNVKSFIESSCTYLRKCADTFLYQNIYTLCRKMMSVYVCVCVCVGGDSFNEFNGPFLYTFRLHPYCFETTQHSTSVIERIGLVPGWRKILPVKSTELIKSSNFTSGCCNKSRRAGDYVLLYRDTL